MNYSEFIKHIDKGEFDSCYLLTGGETFLSDMCLARLIENIVDPATREFNLDILYAGQVDAGKIVDTANSYPMLSDHRVVVVKELNKLPGAGVELLARYAEKPAPTTKLILVSEKLDGRAKGITRLKKACLNVEFKPLYDNQVPVWIEAYLNERGYSISYQAVLLLQAHVGNNLRAIVNEIDKIILNKQDEKNIEEADVQQNVGLSRTFSVFNLNDAIGNRQLAQSLEILHQMLVSGESPTGILAILSRHFVNLLKVKGASENRLSQQEITKMTGIPPYFIKKTNEMAGNFSSEQLQSALQNLLDTELKLKTSSMKPELALQTLLFRIIR